MAKKKVEKTDITVVLPIHELNGDTDIALFKQSLESVNAQTKRPDELLIVVPKGSDVAKTLKDFDFGDVKDIVKVVTNDGKSDFASQMNFGVSKVKTEWFSILEFDDEYSKTWFENVITYREAHDDVDLFMPIVVDINATDNGFMGLTNEAVWANSFSDELGVLDNNALLSFQNFNIDGIAMKKDVYEDFGGFKSNIKLTFIYEFLLRVTFKDAKVMVIPRFGYKHLNQREGSLFHTYRGEMDPVEANWWLSTAKKEYYFDNERDIKYVVEETN
jgi:glycosyltransferase involved in cell wall biosynthesis